VYSCSPELLYAGITTIGVICHEMTHALGAPDFYDTNYETGGSYSGTGNWDVMAGGSWNSNGNRPPHHNMYTKIQFGWVTPVILNSPATIYAMPNSAENPVAYRINTTTNNEHYLLENRQKIKFDSAIPGEGLLIYHVHSNVGTNCINCTHPQKMYPVCASSTYQMPIASPASYGSINSAGCPFPGSSSNTSFTDESTPAMKSWANANTNKPITNITYSNRLISFNFMGGGSGTAYIISAISDPNGIVSPVGETTVYEGGTQSYTIIPHAHYERNTVLINGTNNTTAVNTGSYTFTNVTSNHTIEATFTPNTYTVTFDANGGEGDMEPQDFIYGFEQNLSPNAFINQDLVFKKWNTLANGYGYSYTDEQIISISANIRLFAQWEIKQNEYTITATATSGGEISPTGEIVVVEGESQLFTFIPMEDYTIIDVLVNDVSVGTNPEYLFENVKANHSIHAIFEYNEIQEGRYDYTSLQILPNPANDMIDVRFEMWDMRFEYIEFYNTHGQLVKNVPFNIEIKDNIISQQISITDLSKGIYLVRAGTQSAKLIIQ